MKIKKQILLSLILPVLINTSLTSPATVIDRTPEGIFVGPVFLPDTIPFDPDTLDTLTCFAPTGSRPLYEIAIPIGDWQGGPNVGISQVTINGVKCNVYSLYAEGRARLFHEKWITNKSSNVKNVIILAKALWRNHEHIEAKIEIEGSQNSETRIITGRAPSQGGMPEGTVHYESFSLSEQAGLDRNCEPVEVSVSVYPDEVATPDDKGGLAHELRLFKITERHGPEPAPIQIFETGGVPGTAYREGYLYSPSKTLRLIFFADVPARHSTPYVITYGSSSLPPSPAPTEALKIQGQAPGFTVSNSLYTCTLNEKCGMIESIKMNGQANKDVPVFSNSLTKAMHWNPDCFGSNGEWAHTYAWDPPDRTIITANGPLLFRLTNSGRMPGGAPQVYVSVSYSFYAKTPYIGVTTSMEFRDPYSASAIRNGEIVIDSHLITHFAWKDKAGRLNRIPTLLKTGVHDELTATTEPDIPWVALTNEYDGYGIAAVWTKVDAFHRETGTFPVHRPAYFLYNHQTWKMPIAYFTRAWVYPFAYKDRRPPVMIEPGAFYYEKGAFCPFRFKPGTDDYKQVEQLNTALTQPLILKTGN